MDKLTKTSGRKHIQDAISSEIEMCMKEKGMDMKACAGKAYGMARDKTGQELNYGK